MNRLHKSRLENECDQISPLQSWGPELRYFTALPRLPIVEKGCDITIEKPTFILKIDASKCNCSILKNKIGIHVFDDKIEWFSFI